MAKQVTVIGAGRALGVEIVRLLRARDIDVIATMRTRREETRTQLESLGADVQFLDLTEISAAKDIAAKSEAIIATPILTTSIAIAPFLRDDMPSVFFSSHNVEIDPQAPVYAALLQAEEKLHGLCKNAQIIRPAMIYGYPGDGNISRLMQAMKRFPITPLPGYGKALQQPVHVNDVAALAAEKILAAGRAGAATVIAGPDKISQRALYEAVAKAIGKRPIFAPVPLMAFSRLLAVVEAMGFKLSITSAQLARAGRDKSPTGDNVVLGRISLEEGLAGLAALDGTRRGA